tara:strand:- start:64 stop:411 length:348 start_codon:yes stop_codon:yes gene_type:complete
MSTKTKFTVAKCTETDAIKSLTKLGQFAIKLVAKQHLTKLNVLGKPVTYLKSQTYFTFQGVPETVGDTYELDPSEFTIVLFDYIKPDDGEVLQLKRIILNEDAELVTAEDLEIGI